VLLDNIEYMDKVTPRCMVASYRVMVFNATFNNISVISWERVLLVEETCLPGENHRPVASN
jgi:hypothetical protein